MRERTPEERFRDKTPPKRILCLDGGGLRGSLTLGILKELESFLRRRHGGDPRFRLSDYFDLIAGTSTGAIIAAMLALGRSVEGIYYYYEGMGREVFKTTLLGRLTAGLVRPKYDRETLERYLQDAVGKDTTLGDESLETGLLIVTKRIDKHSVWALGNNPDGQFFDSTEGSFFPNKEYPLWKLLRASAAAPTYFDPVTVEIVADEQAGDFIDGGMSPHNNPSLQALMYATVDGFRVGWETGADKLLMVSVGTGDFMPPEPKEPGGLLGGVQRRLSRLVEPGSTVRKAFFSLMYDNQQLTKTMMQWLSSSETASHIDSEIGALAPDLLAGKELLSYVRLDAELDEKGLERILPSLSGIVRGRTVDYGSLALMDESANVDLMWRIGRVAGASTLHDGLFHPRFDLLDEPGRVLRVGVVGHRHNVLRSRDLQALEARVEGVLARVAQALDGADLCVVSPLAEGADRIAAQVALQRERPFALECPLPFDRVEYERDFGSRRSRHEFRRLLSRADVLWELDGSRHNGSDAYAAVGAEVLDRSDLLLAVWDGQEARGRGGTAEIVRAAAGRMPVIWVHADPAVEPTLVGLDDRGELAPSDVGGLEGVVERLLADRGG